MRNLTTTLAQPNGWTLLADLHQALGTTTHQFITDLKTEMLNQATVISEDNCKAINFPTYRIGGQDMAYIRY